MRFKDGVTLTKLVLVTGSSRGIGRKTAIKFAKEGYNVIVNYKESEEKANEVVEEINKLGRVALAIKADVSKYDEVEEMFNTIFKYFNRLDVLVNNAGIADITPFSDITEEHWRNMFDTNVHGAFNCCKIASKKMISQQEGVIVNMASIWGIIGGSGETHYSATKGAIIAFTKALAKELGPCNIRVNTVAPGAVYTDMLSSISQEVLNKVEDMTPLGKIAYPEQIAEYVYFLASDESDLITGQVISPNGGFTIY